MPIIVKALSFSHLDLSLHTSSLLFDEILSFVFTSQNSKFLLIILKKKQDPFPIPKKSSQVFTNKSIKLYYF